MALGNAPRKSGGRRVLITGINPKKYALFIVIRIII
jgi:hypothetical protein